MMELLIERGASVNASSRHFEHALQTISWTGGESTMKDEGKSWCRQSGAWYFKMASIFQAL
jgi:hypothetical protein